MCVPLLHNDGIKYPAKKGAQRFSDTQVQKCKLTLLGGNDILFFGIACITFNSEYKPNGDGIILKMGCSQHSLKQNPNTN